MDSIWIWVFFSVLAASICIIGIISLVRNKLRSGKVIFDISPIPNRYLYIFMLIATIGSGISTLVPAKTTAEYFVGYGQLFVAIYLLIIVFERVQIREKGIYNVGTLYMWEQIDSYEFCFSPSKGLTLKLNVTQKWLPTKNEISIPQKMQDDIKLTIDNYTSRLKNA